MGMISECPWCDETFESNRYPRSSGYRAVIEQKKEHMKNTHPKKTENYNKIVKIWYEKVHKNKTIKESYIQLINTILGKKGNSSPNYEIVNEYTPQELKDLPEEKIRQIIEKY